MKIKKEISITNTEILENMISDAEGCSVAEARKIMHRAEVEYYIKSSGAHVSGDYKEWVEEIKISYEEE